MTNGETNKYSSILHFRKNKLRFVVASDVCHCNYFAVAFHCSDADTFYGWNNKRKELHWMRTQQPNDKRRHRMNEKRRRENEPERVVFIFQNMNWFGCDQRPSERNRASQRYYFILQMQRHPTATWTMNQPCYVEIGASIADSTQCKRRSQKKRKKIKMK